MQKSEKQFLETMNTYIKVTQSRLRDGRIIDANEELTVMEMMTRQRIAEIDPGAKALKKLAEGENDG